jgi:hypothetical protein
VKSINPAEGPIQERNNAGVEGSGGRGRARGGRGRGRGGRGGRGRTPIPQGTVFFTGGEKKPAPSAKVSATKGTSISAGASRNSKKRDAAAGKTGRGSIDTSTEEVVGQLDTAIGGSGKTKKASILERDYGNSDFVEEGVPSGNTGTSLNLNISSGCMYDSDSSDERSTTKSKTTSLIAPLELPFTSKSLSKGIKPDATSSSHIDEQYCDEDPESAQLASPFVALNDTEGIQNENNSWFLVQLPTRLPPMQKNLFSRDSATEDTDGREQGPLNGPADSIASPSSAGDALNTISDVAVPPVTTSSFDHSLDKNVPGRIGKILVYKSGKTVLVMDGPNDKVISLS